MAAESKPSVIVIGDIEDDRGNELGEDVGIVLSFYDSGDTSNDYSSSDNGVIETLSK